jgi:ribosomal protein S21
MKNKNQWPQGLVVEVVNGDVERALRKLKKKVQNSGLFQELKNHEHFIKPSELRRRDLAQARSRARKRARSEEDNAVDTKLGRYDS